MLRFPQQVTPAAPVRRQLSRGQKWDLGVLVAAGLVSTALFSAPMLLPAPPQVASVGNEPIAPVGSLPAVQIATAIHAAVVTVPDVRTVLPREKRAVTRRVPRAPKDSAFVVARATTPLVRKLGRLVVGDGRYVVRPFPTIDSEQR